MEKDVTIKNPIFPKEDIFLEHLNHNNDPLKNEDFSIDTFDKFFNEEESIKKPKKSINLPIECSPISNRNNNKFNDKIINGGKEKLFSLNNIFKDNNNENAPEINQMKKQLFNTLQNIESNEDLKKKKLILNRESAKKSRLKKKQYIENLEKEFVLLREELIKIKSLRNLNNKNNLDNTSENFSNNNNIIENIIYHNKNMFNIDMNSSFNVNNHKDKEFLSLKKEEFNIISNNLEKDSNVVNSYINKQKKILQNLLIKQIDIITPLTLKDFQNKFLKLEEIKKDDTISIIKNKINNNLEAIIELYDINIEEKNNKKNINKKFSKGNNIYNFYNDLKKYVEQYELLYNNIDNFIIQLK